MDAKTILVAARALLSDTSRWCASTSYADANGNDVETRDEARRYCAIGALQVVAGVVRPVCWIDELTVASDFELSQAAFQLEAAAQKLEGRGITRVNDHQGYNAMMRCYDYAIDCADRFMEGSAA